MILSRGVVTDFKTFFPSRFGDIKFAMRRRRWKIVFFSGLVISVAVAGNAPASITHECSYCHITSNKGAGMPRKAPLSGLCLECHPDRTAGNEHIVDIVPSLKVAELPLSKDGKITCATCHDPHEQSGYPYLLRVSPAELCQKCHLK